MLTLDAVGLHDVATIVMEAAADALPASVMHCPYAEDDLRNYQSWQLSRLRRSRPQCVLTQAAKLADQHCIFFPMTAGFRPLLMCFTLGQ